MRGTSKEIVNPLIKRTSKLGKKNAQRKIIKVLSNHKTNNIILD